MTNIEIANLRKSMGLTQVEFAQLFDTHHMTVSKWERGVLSPSSYQIALMNQFSQAVAKVPDPQEELQQLLVGAGVIATLFWLLSKAK